MKRSPRMLLVTNPRRALPLTVAVLSLLVAVDPAAAGLPMERPPGQDIEFD
ncbi:hypothetical protein [Halorientalis sp.]|uniref:hypothetical protein n=1 Tax=Halorientalis sp. TaxID=1931229 RepID=UPI0026104F73|nr:hypothetical protein [Halorientalis sp.]